MENRKCVYAFKNVHGMTSVVNYDAQNTEVNSFISKFDGWGSNGEFKTSINGDHKEVWFECFKEFWDILHSEVFETAFDRMGVKLVFEYPKEMLEEKDTIDRR